MKFKVGDRVVIVKEPSVFVGIKFPRLGKSGTIISAQDDWYYIKFKEVEQTFNSAHEDQVEHACIVDTDLWKALE